MTPSNNRAQRQYHLPQLRDWKLPKNGFGHDRRHRNREDAAREALRSAHPRTEAALRRTGKIGEHRPEQVRYNSDLAALCNKEQDFAKVPIDRIAEVVKPEGPQHAAFEDLRKISQTAADDLQASCPSQMPDTPVARLSWSRPGWMP